jgi:hypothetical protein
MQQKNLGIRKLTAVKSAVSLKYKSVRNNSVYPHALLDEYVSEDAFGNVKKLYAEVDGEDGHCGVVCGDEREGNGQAPGKSAVEDQGKKRLSSRTEREIKRIQKPLNREETSRYYYKELSVTAYFFRGVIEFREDARKKNKYSSKKNTYPTREFHKRESVLFGLFVFHSAERLTCEYSDGRA